MYIVTQCLSETLSHEAVGVSDQSKELCWTHSVCVSVCVCVWAGGDGSGGLVQTQWGRRDLRSIPLPEERTAMHCTTLMQIEKRIRQTMIDCSHRLMKGQ